MLPRKMEIELPSITLVLKEDWLITYTKLSCKMHDNMLEPHHECLFAADIQHVYHTIRFHEDECHSFAFTLVRFNLPACRNFLSPLDSL